MAIENDGEARGRRSALKRELRGLLLTWVAFAIVGAIVATQCAGPSGQ